MNAGTFNLFIRGDYGESTYRVSADEPDGPSFVAEFSPSEKFATALLRLHARGPDRVHKTVLDQDIDSSLVGETLFTTFLKGPTSTPVSDALDQFLAASDPEHPQRLALHLPRQLYGLPWELLRDRTAPPGDFLSLFHSVIRIDGEAKGNDPRYARFPPTEPTLQVLFVASNPNDRLIGDFEPQNTGEVSFHRVSPATYSNFLSFTAKTDIRPDSFVFLGHGDVADNYGVLIFIKWEGLWVKTPVSDARAGYTVASDLVRRQRLRFGCLLACETAWTNNRIPFENTVVGSLLSRTRIPFVLGAQSPIGVYAAQEFLIGVVEALHRKEPLDFAVTNGRRRVHAASAAVASSTPLDWWIPVLYSKTTTFEVVTEAPLVEIPTSTRAF